MNMYFTTTREHIEIAGGTYVDVIVDEADDPKSRYRSKVTWILRNLIELSRRKAQKKLHT